MRNLHKSTVDTISVENSNLELRVSCICMGVLSYLVAVDDDVGVTAIGNFAIANFVSTNFVQLKELPIFSLIRVTPGDFGGFLAFFAG